MNKELIIQSAPAGIEIALLEDKKLVELHYDNSGGEFNVGDLYLGKIKKVMPGLNAVFVDIGFEKDAFLHYTDLSPHFNSILKFTQMSMANNNLPDFGKFTLEEQIDKSGIIAETIKGKPNILVQVIKEPISNKGPRITCELSLPGRFIVMMPFNNSVNISRNISSNDERKRLEKIIKSIKTDNFGIIVRTAAEG
ncbi:MAG: ribonuclease E/G, partial [Chitinophagaceae bacterium]|nr:ribonuclease E/G [Chitinophagaceae bacterium]